MHLRSLLFNFSGRVQSEPMSDRLQTLYICFALTTTEEIIHFLDANSSSFWNKKVHPDEEYHTESLQVSVVCLPSMNPPTHT